MSLEDNGVPADMRTDVKSLSERSWIDRMTALTRPAFASAAILAGALGTAEAQDSFQLAQNSRQIPGGYVGGSTGGASDVGVRVDRTEAQMRQLTGQIEELTHQVRQLQEQLRRMQEDNEFRFQELEAARGKKRSDLSPQTPARPADEMSGFTDVASAPQVGGGVDAGGTDLGPVGQPVDGTYGNSSATLGAPPAPLGSMADAGGGYDPNSGPLDLTAMTNGGGYDPASTGSLGGTNLGGADLGTAPNGGFSQGTLAAPAGGNALPGVSAGEPMTASDAYPSAAAGTQLAAIPNPSNSREVYDAAYNHMMRGEYSDAEAGFRHFIEAYPGDTLAADAEFWLGESLYARSDYRAAAQAFLKGYTEYPDSRKAPDALFKLGLSLNGMGERDAACASFKELLQKYPGASNALKDRVRGEQKTAKC